MPKDKNKRDRDKEDELYLAGLKGMVRFREILRRLKASSVEADLATQALDDMFTKAVSDLRADFEKGLKAIKDTIDARLKAQDSKQNWLIGVASLIAVLLAIITLAQTGVLPR